MKPDTHSSLPAASGFASTMRWAFGFASILCLASVLCLAVTLPAGAAEISMSGSLLAGYASRAEDYVDDETDWPSHSFSAQADALADLGSVAAVGIETGYAKLGRRPWYSNLVVPAIWPSYSNVKESAQLFHTSAAARLRIPRGWARPYATASLGLHVVWLEREGTYQAGPNPTTIDEQFTDTGLGGSVGAGVEVGSSPWSPSAEIRWRTVSTEHFADDWWTLAAGLRFR